MSNTPSRAGRPDPDKGGPSLLERYGPGAFADARFNPYRIVGVFLVLALAIGLATYVGNRGNDSTTNPSAGPTAPHSTGGASPQPSPTGPTDPASLFRAGISEDYRFTVSIVLNYAQVLQMWDKGEASDTELKGIFDVGILNFVMTRDQLEARAPFEPAPQVLRTYRQANALYLESARIGKAALTVPPGPLRDELRDQVQRLRVLGERTFDAAGAELKPFLPDSSDAEGVIPPQSSEIPDEH